jgi:hypothetical protein
MRLRVVQVAVLAALAGVVTAGCSSDDDGGSAAPASPSASATTTASAAPSATATVAALPETCDDALPLLDLDRALGTTLVGRTSYIEGEPDPKINRTGRMTCRYGIPVGRAGSHRLELSVSTYTDEASAADRVEVTVLSARQQGARSAEVRVGGEQGFLLTRGGIRPTLVVASGTRTVALTVANGVLTSAQTQPALVRVTEVVLTNLP